MRLEMFLSYVGMHTAMSRINPSTRHDLRTRILTFAIDRHEAPRFLGVPGPMSTIVDSCLMHL